MNDTVSMDLMFWYFIMLDARQLIKMTETGIVLRFNKWIYLDVENKAYFSLLQAK